MFYPLAVRKVNRKNFPSLQCVILCHFGVTVAVNDQNSALAMGERSKRQLLNYLLWPIYVINSVENTELPCYTFQPTQHHSSLRNLPTSFTF